MVFRWKPEGPALATALIESVRHHLEEEEQEVVEAVSEQVVPLVE